MLLNFIAFLFTFTGLSRLLIFSEDNRKERYILYNKLPYGEIFIALSEVILGILLLTKYYYYSLCILAIGILVFTFLVLYTQWKNVLFTINKCFTYRGTFISVILHITYLIIILHLLYS